MEEDKIYITGTGRCGTTFLIKLFTFLHFDTGFNKNNYKNYIFRNCNSGMEKLYNEKCNVIKNPTILQDIQKIIQNNISIKYVIIPIRDYTQSAKSRVKHNNLTGGLWEAKNEEEQIIFYNKIMAEYIFYMCKYDIPTIFIDFDKMVNDKKYLFDKLKPILDSKNIDFLNFSYTYDEVNETSKPKNYYCYNKNLYIK